jgi:hypothetical protein
VVVTERQLQEVVLAQAVTAEQILAVAVAAHHKVIMCIHKLALAVTEVLVSLLLEITNHLVVLQPA